MIETPNSLFLPIHLTLASQKKEKVYELQDNKRIFNFKIKKFDSKNI